MYNIYTYSIHKYIKNIALNVLQITNNFIFPEQQVVGQK